MDGIDRSYLLMDCLSVRAQGNWLCMLDSDDLLGKDYLQRAADFVQVRACAATFRYRGMHI